MKRLTRLRLNPRYDLLDEGETSSVDAWSFDVSFPHINLSRSWPSSNIWKIFRIAHSIPQEAKARLLEESIADALEWSCSSTSARAAFQAALAFIERFGTPEDFTEARCWLSVSVAKGFLLENDLFAYFEASLSHILGKEFSGELNGTCDWNFAEFVRIGFEKKVLKALPPEILSEIPVTEQDMSRTMMKRASSAILSPDGDTLLQLSFKLRRHGLAKWLLEQQNFPWNFDQAGCGPLHWLFMFAGEEMEQIAEVLIRGGDAESHVQQHVNALSATEEFLDPQLPIRLCGTPLAFATSCGSQSAINYLLSLGADPLLGSTYPRQTVRSQHVLSPKIGLFNSALHIACKYHNFRALRSYFFEAFAQTAPNERLNLQRKLLHFCTGVYSSATRTEKLMYHGRSANKAAKSVASFLLTLYEESEPNGLYMYRLLQPAILRGDLDAAYGILTAIRESEGINFRSYLHPQEHRMLISHCVQQSCTGNHHPEVVYKMLEFAIAAGSDINCGRFGSKTKRPINMAIQHRDKFVFDWLVSHGADLNALDEHGLSPLYHMITSNFFSIYDVAEIVKLGASTKLGDGQGLDALSLAIEKDEASVLKSLIRCERESGLGPRYGDLLKSAISSLVSTGEQASKNGKLRLNVGVVTTVLNEAKNDQEVLHEPLRYALSQACLHGWTDLARIFLKHGCPLLPEVGSDRSPLFLAASHGHLDIVRILLDAGIDPNHHSSATETDWLQLILLLSTADLSRVYKCVESLVEAGADVGFQHLELAVQKPRPPDWQDLAQLLLDRGVDPTQRRDIWISDSLEPERYDVDLATFIAKSGTLTVSTSENSNVTLQLLARRPPPDPDDVGVLTSLYPLTKYVISTGCKIFRIDENGNTPLQNALAYRNTSVFSALLEEHHEFGHDDLKSMISNIPLTVLLVQKRVREKQERNKDEILNWALLRSCWLQSISREYWDIVVSFLRLGIVGPTHTTSWRMSEIFGDERARRFLRWAMDPPYYFKREVPEVLALFFGTSDMCPPHIRLPRKDDHLAGIVGRLPLEEGEREKISVFQKMKGYAPERIRNLYFEEGRQPERNMIIFLGIDYGKNPPPPSQMSILFEDEVEKDATLENLQLLGSFNSDRITALPEKYPTPSYHVNWMPGSISGDSEDSSRYRAITSFFYSLSQWKRTLLFWEWRRSDDSSEYTIHDWRHYCEKIEGQWLMRGVNVPPQ